MYFASLFAFCMALIGNTHAVDVVSPTCDTTQYLHLGGNGTLVCFFHKEFFSVLWYNTTDYNHNDPILHYQNLVKSGSGYETGEYDIHPNGSLIINQVSVQHETVFTVAYVHTKKEGPVLFNIRVVTVVKPDTEFPYIETCGNHTRYCYSQIYSSSLQCSVHGVRPNVTLKWIARTTGGDKNIPNDISTVSKGLTFTSYAIGREVFHYSSLLVLLVCKATGPPGILESNESMVLAQSRNIDLRNTETISKYIEYQKVMELNCSNDDFKFIVWKKATSFDDAEHDLLLYAVFTGDIFSATFAGGGALGSGGSFVVQRVEINHEGLYYCIFGDGLKDGVVVFNVTVIAYPDPPYLTVDGCISGDKQCALTAEYKGILTCSVTAIRPRVELAWRTFYDRDKYLISFTNQQMVVNKNGDTVDVRLTTSYHVTDESRGQLTIECIVVQPNIVGFDLSTKVDMLFVKGISTEEPEVAQTSNRIILIIVVFVVVLLLTSTASAVLIQKQIRKRRKSASEGDVSETAEREPMFPEAVHRRIDEQNTELRTIHSNFQNLDEMKQLFINQLKEKYKDLCDAIQPIPYIKDRLYCVENIFVEGGIELLRQTRGTENWERLESYKDIFNEQGTEFTRLILEGEPGYGKSTVTLQLAYDWCNKKETSKLKDIDILILLRLRQLGGVSSIFTAIKHFLLPYDSLLNEGHITSILSNNKSVVIILDGYDEYPDQDKATDVMKILERNMFQNTQVILTTRSSCFPKKFSPQTKRVKLTGFDHRAQEHYIRKALIPKDSKAVEKVKLSLQENAVLRGLFQVPLFFVMFAHMMLESDVIFNFDSVTNFFRHMIACFHEHMRNKMVDENVEKYDLYENEHAKLDKVAFDALFGNNQIVWLKADLRKRLGKHLYDAYIRLGILVEEEVLSIANEEIRKKTEVRFYHKLFCEWYAAYFVSNYAARTVSFKLGSIIRKMNPFDIQYLYRFACGLNATASGKIIKHIKKLEGGDKFAILCILEQTGSVDNVQETIRQLCTEGITISDQDSLLLQMSSVQLLEIAAKNEIPISLLRLHDSLESVDHSAVAIKTLSGLIISSRLPVKWLQVSFTKRRMTSDGAVSVLTFASKCSSLKALWYLGCVPPQSFERGPTLSTLKSRDVKVQWRRTKNDPVFVLNLQTGQWEREEDGSHATAEDFEILKRNTKPGNDFS